jgi:uroporphyrinogen-III synthase
MPKIWVTQTLPRAEESAADFRALGLEPTVSPVLDIVFTKDDIHPPTETTVLLFTSRNGVRAFCHIHEDRNYEVYCVGDATAKLAEAQGFTQIASASGDVTDLQALVERSVSVSRPVRHCSGRHVRGRLTENLLDAGFAATRIEYYAAQPRKVLNFDPNQFDYIAIYSPLAAQSVTDLLVLQELDGFTALSISANTDAALGGTYFKKRLIAESPDQAEMIQALRLDLDRRNGQI